METRFRRFQLLHSGTLVAVSPPNSGGSDDRIGSALLCLGDTVLPILYRAGMISERKMAGLWTIDVLFMLLLAVWIALLALVIWL